MNRCCIKCNKLLEYTTIRHAMDVFVILVISWFVRDAIAVTLALIVRGIIGHISVE